MAYDPPDDDGIHQIKNGSAHCHWFIIVVDENIDFFSDEEIGKYGHPTPVFRNVTNDNSIIVTMSLIRLQ